MKIKDLDELEILLNQINISLNQTESLTKALLDNISNEMGTEFFDIQNLISVLNDKIIDLKEKFKNVIKDLHI